MTVLSALIGTLLQAASADSAAALPPGPGVQEVAALHLALEGSKARFEELEQKVKVLERLRENDQEDAAAAAKAAPKVQIGAGGLWLRSADSSYGIRFRGIVRTGANWDLDDLNDKTLDQFQNTTVRFGFDGVVGKSVEYKINSDWSKGSVALQDAYFDLKLASWLGLRVGKFQVPLGLERFVSPSDLLFYDRALPSQIAPNRDVGAQFQGAFAGNRIQYAVGVFNGGPDASNLNGDKNDDKDVYGRLWLLPLKGLGEWVEGLGLGFGANAGYHANDAPSPYKTTSGNTFFSWNAADTLAGSSYRLAPQAQWTAGPFLAYGEWILSSQSVRRGVLATYKTDSVGTGSANKGVVYRPLKGTTAALDAQDISTSAWQAAISYVLTGEDANPAGVSPRHPFDFSKGDWGAFEISARISGLDVDDAAFAGSATKDNLADSTGAARSALSYGAALNWHLVKGTRVQVGFERTQFADGAVVDPNASTKVVRDRKSENQLFAIASTSF